MADAAASAHKYGRGLYIGIGVHGRESEDK